MQQQKKVYSLEQIWRFLSVQIKHSGLIEEKIRAIDGEEEDVSEESDTMIDITSSTELLTKKPPSKE